MTNELRQADKISDFSAPRPEGTAGEKRTLGVPNSPTPKGVRQTNEVD